MASQVNRDFFKKAKKVDRAIELRDNEAVIPAVKERAEVRAKLPNRRLLTVEERTAILEKKRGEISLLEDQIEVERKALLEAVKVYETTKSGASEVVAQNLKVKELMEKRSAVSRPEIWIESLSGLSLKDVFASKRDDRKIGADVFQVKRRVEPLLSLYVDLEAASGAATVTGAATGAVTVAPGPLAAVASLMVSAEPAAPKTVAEAAQGAIIGQKRVLKSKKTAAMAAPSAPASAPSFSS